MTRKIPNSDFVGIIEELFLGNEDIGYVKAKILLFIDKEGAKKSLLTKGLEVINGSDTEKKERFLNLLCKYIGMGTSLDTFSFNILTFLHITLDEFSHKYSTLFMSLTTRHIDKNERLNICIKIMLIFLNNGDFEQELKALEYEISKGLEEILGAISKDGESIGNYSKEKIIFLIKMIGVKKLFGSNKLKESLSKTLSSFLEGELSRFLTLDEDYIKNIGFSRTKKQITKSQDEDNSGLNEINSFISNGNFTKNPLIVVFRSFPGNKLKVLVYQHQELFSPTNHKNLKIFNSDKSAFLEEIGKINAEYRENIPSGEIFSISAYIKIGNSNKPSQILDLSGLELLVSSNDNVRLEEQAA